MLGKFCEDGMAVVIRFVGNHAKLEIRNNKKEQDRTTLVIDQSVYFHFVPNIQR